MTVVTTSDDTEKRVVTKPAAVVTNSKKGVSSISINKNLKDATHKLHSYGWRVKWIDGEQCLYKKLNPTFDVEVSGINNRKTKNYSVNVFVWEITPDIKIVVPIQS